MSWSVYIFGKAIRGFDDLFTYYSNMVIYEPTTLPKVISEFKRCTTSVCKAAEITAIDLERPKCGRIEAHKDAKLIQDTLNLKNIAGFEFDKK